MLYKDEKQIYIDELKKLQKEDDYELAHYNADCILCDLLCDIGYEDIVKEWEKIPKWYA